MICPFCGKEEVDYLIETPKKSYYKCRSCRQFFGSTNAIHSTRIGKSNQPTSAMAKKKIEVSGEAESQRNYIYDTIQRNPNISIRELSTITGLQKSSISPRLYELRKQKKVVQSGWKKFPDGEVMVWSIPLRL